MTTRPRPFANPTRTTAPADATSTPPGSGQPGAFSHPVRVNGITRQPEPDSARAAQGNASIANRADADGDTGTC
jgi:hypothetical protein